MATYGWGKDSSVADGLFLSSHEFDFYQAVRLLEVMFPEKAPVGEGAEPGKEVVSFKGKTSLDFPASEISAIHKPKTESEPVVMLENFMSLSGALGPMPQPHNELLIERIWRKDTAFRDFLDIFNHRLVSLMYRIRKNSRIGIKTKPPGEDSFQSILFSLLGLRTVHTTNRMNVKDRSFLAYAGLFAGQCRSMVGLEKILSDYFQISVQGETFKGQWQGLEPDQWSTIGRSGKNQILGETLVLGTRFWDQAGKFRLYIGPMTLEKMNIFFPGSVGFDALCDITRLFTRNECNFDIQLTVKASEVPSLRLGKKHGSRLGWSSWLKTKEFVKNDSQVIISPN